MRRNHPIMPRQRRKASAQNEQGHRAGHLGVLVGADFPPDIDRFAEVFRHGRALRRGIVATPRPDFRSAKESWENRRWRPPARGRASAADRVRRGNNPVDISRPPAQAPSCAPCRRGRAGRGRAAGPGVRRRGACARNPPRRVRTRRGAPLSTTSENVSILAASPALSRRSSGGASGARRRRDCSSQSSKASA